MMSSTERWDCPSSELVWFREAVVGTLGVNEVTRDPTFTASLGPSVSTASSCISNGHRSPTARKQEYDDINREYCAHY